MKKFSIIFLLTLAIVSVANLTSPPGASAMRVDADGATWWSVPELLEYKKQSDLEMDEQCGDDGNCRQELYFLKIESEDQKFRALEMLTEQQFILTGVNPSKNTIKVLFFDEDMMLSHMGVKEQLNLESLYIGLFDYQIERVYNYSASADDYASGSVSGVHEVYLWDNRSDTPADIIANQESELYNASGLPLEAFDRFGYSIFAGQFNAQGQLHYGSCFRDSNYKEGEECHLMISSDKGTAFFVPREETTTSNVDSTTEVTTNQEEPTTAGTQPSVQDEQKGSDNQPSQNTEDASSKQDEPTQVDLESENNLNNQNDPAKADSVAQSENTSWAKAPETGAAPSGEEQNISALPQTAPFTTLGIAITALIIIFLAKKSKKRVDNATGV